MSLSFTRLFAMLLALSYGSSAMAGYVLVGNPARIAIQSADEAVTSAVGEDTEVAFFDETGDLIELATISDADLAQGIIVDVPEEASSAEVLFVTPILVQGEDELGPFVDQVHPDLIDLNVTTESVTEIGGDLPLTIETLAAE